MPVGILPEYAQINHSPLLTFYTFLGWSSSEMV